MGFTGCSLDSQSPALLPPPVQQHREGDAQTGGRSPGIPLQKAHCLSHSFPSSSTHSPHVFTDCRICPAVISGEVSQHAHCCNNT